MSSIFSDLLHAYPDDADATRRYERKPNGGRRPITVPNKPLKEWHRRVLQELDKKHPTWPKYIHGGVKRRSFVTFAKPHVDQQQVITVDIAKCFDSITGEEVAASLQKYFGLSSHISNELAFALCYNDRLAQGFPTSSFLCNLYLSEQLGILSESFNAAGIRFGSYVDDIAISGVIDRPDEAINLIAISLSRAKLKMKKAKVHVMPSSGQQVVCGLIVNKRLRITSDLEQKLYTGIKSGAIGERSALGWVAHIKSFDPTLSKKLLEHAIKCGVIKQKTKT